MLFHLNANIMTPPITLLSLFGIRGRMLPTEVVRQGREGREGQRSPKSLENKDRKVRCFWSHRFLPEFLTKLSQAKDPLLKKRLS